MGHANRITRRSTVVDKAIAIITNIGGNISDDGKSAYVEITAPGNANNVAQILGQMADQAGGCYVTYRSNGSTLTVTASSQDDLNTFFANISGELRNNSIALNNSHADDLRELTKAANNIVSTNQSLSI